MSAPFVRRIARATLLSCLASAVANAQTLGTISFPNSGNAAAQSPFIRGVLYLHSFEYESAAAAFRSSSASVGAGPHTNAAKRGVTSGVEPSAITIPIGSCTSRV